MAATRVAAQRAIAEGRVTVGGLPAMKPATLVSSDAPLVISDGAKEWASRAGTKLAAALDAFDVVVDGRRCLDVGASTGGFTDVLIESGARSVVAIDVGYGQMVSRLATNERVTVVDRTNFRLADPASLGAPFDLVTMDVSFISAATLAPQLVACGADRTDYVILVKPQFEAGREALGRGGIVKDVVAHTDSVESVADALRVAGAGAIGVLASPITGNKGNREFLIHARLGEDRSITANDILEVTS